MSFLCPWSPCYSFHIQVKKVKAKKDDSGTSNPATPEVEPEPEPTPAATPSPPVHQPDPSPQASQVLPYRTV